MLRLLGLGLLAALFFSSTFVLNRSMSLDGGHWFWSACLRFAWMLGLLILWFLISGRYRKLTEAWLIFFRHLPFWICAGTVGFGIFYSSICFSASYTPGWVIATTWQTTILASPLVLILFGKKVPKSAMAFTLLIACGILIVNLSQGQLISAKDLLLGGLPVLLAAFAYPTGNQMLWEAQRNGYRRIPRIADPALHDPFIRVLLMTCGSVPYWIILYLVIRPDLPAQGQIISTGLVALLSGIVATSLFLQARHLAQNSYELAAVDATQSGEVVFSLIGEVLFLQGKIPGIYALAGVILTLVGLTLYISRRQPN